MSGSWRKSMEGGHGGPPHWVKNQPSSAGWASVPAAFPELNWDDLRYERLSERPSKVRLDDLGHPSGPDSSLEDWLEGLPRLLGAAALKRLRDEIVRACEAGRPVVAALGGHVIKTGCAPYLIDW